MKLTPVLTWFSGLAPAGGACAQSLPLEWNEIEVKVDSGRAHARADHAPPAGVGQPGAGARQVVFSRVVGERDARWLRLFFDEVELPGSFRDETNAILRLTSLADGAQQHLSAHTIRQWSNSSAYFNGSFVLVELLVHAAAPPARVVIDRLHAGLPQGDAMTFICDGVDERVPSYGAADAQMWPVGCTAFLIGEVCLISAGHCFPSGWPTPVATFNVFVPGPQGGGTGLFVGPEDQYAMDQQSSKYQPQACGNDWWYFGVYPNSETGLTPLAAQGENYTLASEMPQPDNQTVRIHGYGNGTWQLPLEWHQKQKVAYGPFIELDGTLIEHRADVNSGDSGSAILEVESDEVIGIVTCGGCTADGGSNKGTAIAHHNLRAALNSPSGVCACPLDGMGPLAVELPNCPTTAVMQGSGADNQVMTVSHECWGDVHYTIAIDADWLSVYPTSGVTSGNPVEHILSYYTENLPPGTHIATMLVSAPDTPTPVRTFRFTLRVTTSCHIQGVPVSSDVGLSSIGLSLAPLDDGSGPALYVGGSFMRAGGIEVGRIARWDGSSWSPVGSGFDNGAVHAITLFDDGTGPSLIAGGTFTSSDGVEMNGVARWDGRSWQPLGSGFNNSVVYTLGVFDDGSGPALFAGGAFTNSGGKTVNRIARWDPQGGLWQQVGSGINDGTVRTMIVFDDGGGPALYIGGELRPSPEPPWRYAMARWDDPGWTFLPGMLAPYFVAALDAVVFDDGHGTGPQIVAAGIFHVLDSVQVSHIAKWDSAAFGWAALQSGVSSGVRGLTVHDDGTGTGPALIAVGQFTSASGNPALRVAHWNGSSWFRVGAGGGVTVHAAASFDDGAGFGPQLYVTGLIPNNGCRRVNHIARWNGVAWSSVGGEDLPLCKLGDLNGDGVVDQFDTAILFDGWGACPPPDEGHCIADLNGDGFVNVNDLLILFDNWG